MVLRQGKAAITGKKKQAQERSEETSPIASFRCTDSASKEDGRQGNEKKTRVPEENRAQWGESALSACRQQRLTGAPKSRTSQHSRSRSTEAIQ
ncbi:hypothetical protein NDU88_011588 [Pleurodeles waltl]|uniref:Uncharacterized protein n=1 Tax=Pleurodeles waltl TaxID=8319 RepID=A0AAV7S1K8_PLEWA|nr:hypothetical protein NDU88_011588 [Pleurodeles waltl]